MFNFCLVHADDFLERKHLSQLHSLRDSSIVGVESGKYYINAERVSLTQEGLQLHSDCFSPLLLKHLFQDDDGIFVMSAFSIYKCDGCPRYYNSPPSQCECGSTTFTLIDLLPD